MIISLYMLLVYTWNTNLQIRYKNIKINYSLSGYWHGGLSRNVNKIGRNPEGGNLFNNNNRVGDNVIAKVMMQHHVYKKRRTSHKFNRSLVVCISNGLLFYVDYGRHIMV